MPQTEKTKGCNALTACLAVAATVGVSAAAFLIVRRLRSAAAIAEPQSLLDMCERAASQLDARLTGGDDIAYAI